MSDDLFLSPTAHARSAVTRSQLTVPRGFPAPLRARPRFDSLALAVLIARTRPASVPTYTDSFYFTGS
jgi:hypothetical protein